MADGWGTAQTLAQVEAVAQMVDGLWQAESTDAEGIVTPGRIIPQGRLADGSAEWAYVGWGPCHLPTGKTVKDSMGNDVPETASDGLYHFLLRWNGDPAKMPFAAAGGTVTIDPDTGAMTLVAGPVTMVFPPPADCPVSF